MFTCVVWALGLLPQSYQYPNLSEGADRVGGQLRGDKECPFSGVTKSGRVWRRVPESDARRGGRCRKRRCSEYGHIPLLGHTEILHTLLGQDG